MISEIPLNEKIVKGLRFAESIRNLDERAAIKIALALAGTHPELFVEFYETTRKQNLIPVPVSTVVLTPPPANPNEG